MADEIKTEFRVKKVTYMRKQCTNCGGTGKKEMKINGMFKQVPCVWCQNGITQIEHLTDVSLKDALNEMGIYKMIENTVKEVLTTDNTD